MRVQDVMTREIATASPDTNLAEVAHRMWEFDCGFVPVNDAVGKIVGVITDRDICIASATRRLLPEQITAGEAMRRGPVHAAQPEDTLPHALAAMKKFQVRRLPVIAADGTLKGIISINDIVLASQRKGGPAPAEIASALAAICAHRPPKIAAA